jgi:hypothetical protein
MRFRELCLAGCLLLTALVTPLYWVVFFTLDDARLSGADWYLRFEQAFPAADGWMAVCCALGGVGLLRRSAWGPFFSLLAAGALVFLGLLDLSFEVQNGLWTFPGRSGAEMAAAAIDVWTLALGVALAAAHAPFRNAKASGGA